MSALPSSSSSRAVGLTMLAVLVGVIGTIAWHSGLSPHSFFNLAHQSPSWAAVSIVILVAACVSSTVGFAFSAIAAGMILHFVPDTIEAVQIMMVASIAIQAYSVAGLWRSISWRACAPFLIGGMAAMPLGIYARLNLRPQAYAVTMEVALTLYGA